MVLSFSKIATDVSLIIGESLKPCFKNLNDHKTTFEKTIDCQDSLGYFEIFSFKQDVGRVQRKSNKL